MLRVGDRVRSLLDGVMGTVWSLPLQADFPMVMVELDDLDPVFGKRPIRSDLAGVWEVVDATDR